MVSPMSAWLQLSAQRQLPLPFSFPLCPPSPVFPECSRSEFIEVLPVPLAGRCL